MIDSRFGEKKSNTLKLTSYSYLAYSVSLSGCLYTLNHCVLMWPFMYFTKWKKMKSILLKHLSIPHTWTIYIIRCFLDCFKKQTDISFNFKTAIKYWGIIIINKACNSYILWFYSILEINALLIFLLFSLCSLIIVMMIIMRFTLSSFAEDRGTMTYTQLFYLLWSPLASNWASVFHLSII